MGEGFHRWGGGGGESPGEGFHHGKGGVLSGWCADHHWLTCMSSQKCTPDVACFYARARVCVCVCGRCSHVCARACTCVLVCVGGGGGGGGGASACACWRMLFHFLLVLFLYLLLFLGCLLLFPLLVIGWNAQDWLCELYVASCASCSLRRKQPCLKSTWKLHRVVCLS